VVSVSMNDALPSLTDQRGSVGVTVFDARADWRH
jgi:hypothetical protein